MNYVFMVAFAVIAAIALFIFARNKGEKRSEICVKAVSIALFVLLFMRIFAYVSKLETFTLVEKSYAKQITIAPEGKAVSTVALFAECVSLAAAVLLVCRGFFKVATVDRLTLFAAPIACVYGFVSLPAVISVSVGTAAGEISFASVCVAAQNGLLTALVAYHWFMAIKNKEIPLFKGYRDVLAFIFALVTGICAALPNYWNQFLFGRLNVYASELMDFRLWHRIFLYGAILLPVSAYFAVRGQSEEIKKCTLIYFTVVAMFVYCHDYTFVGMVRNPSSLPLHLCNTPMFIIPLCLVFKTKRLFYFTYFINVFGALIAMSVPNYGSDNSINATGIIRFWYNHYYAFYMPLLLVALKVFDRPTLKQFVYSIVGFLFYFAFALFMNVYFRASGFPTTDYFFLSGTHIVGKLGTWAQKIYDITLGFTIGEKTFTLNPVYHSIVFAVYVGFGMAMWVLYELGFSLVDAHGALTGRTRKIRLDKYALTATLGGRSIEEPMNKDAGIKLELKHFSKKYGTSTTYAVSDANLEVHGGEIFGFLGPNGAGKSTIIKSFVGIQPITEGAIEICGFDCEKQPVQAKSVIGYVPDHYALYEKLTGREYVNYIADIYDVSREDRTERIEKHIKMFELQGSIDNPIKTYSHGMKQKITIMAALVHEPKLWILDEPLTGLDPNSIFQVKECMKQHAAKGNIVFFSSHIIDVVERICNRITIIKKGKILVTRDVADIEKECPLEEYYMKMIGDAPEGK